MPWVAIASELFEDFEGLAGTTQPMRPKLAAHLPAPKPLTAEEMERVTQEARELRVRIDRALDGMETTPDNVRLR